MTSNKKVLNNKVVDYIENCNFGINTCHHLRLFENLKLQISKPMNLKQYFGTLNNFK